MTARCVSHLYSEEGWWVTYQVGDEARDLRSTNDQRSRDKDRVGLDKSRNLRKTHARPYQ